MAQAQHEDPVFNCYELQAEEDLGSYLVDENHLNASAALIDTYLRNTAFNMPIFQLIVEREIPALSFAAPHFSIFHPDNSERRLSAYSAKRAKVFCMVSLPNFLCSMTHGP